MIKAIDDEGHDQTHHHACGHPHHDFRVLRSTMITIKVIYDKGADASGYGHPHPRRTAPRAQRVLGGAHPRGFDLSALRGA